MTPPPPPPPCCLTSELRNVKKVGCRNPRQASLRQRKKTLWGSGRPQKHSVTPLSGSWWGRATLGSCHTPLLPFSSPRHPSPPSPLPFQLQTHVTKTDKSRSVHPIRDASPLGGQGARQAGRQALRGMTQWFPPCKSLPSLPSSRPSALSSLSSAQSSSPPPRQSSSFQRGTSPPPPARITPSFIHPSVTHQCPSLGKTKSWQ